jgi:hypothetical protein
VNAIDRYETALRAYHEGNGTREAVDAAREPLDEFLTTATRALDYVEHNRMCASLTSAGCQCGLWAFRRAHSAVVAP